MRDFKKKLSHLLYFRNTLTFEDLSNSKYIGYMKKFMFQKCENLMGLSDELTVRHCGNGGVR